MQSILCPENSEHTTRSYLLFFVMVTETQVPHWPLSAIRLLCKSFSPGVSIVNRLVEKRSELFGCLPLTPFPSGNEHSFRDVTMVLGLIRIDFHSSRWSQSEPISKPSAFSTYLLFRDVIPTCRELTLVQQHSRYEA